MKLPIFALRKGRPSTSELVFQILSARHPLTISAIREELVRKYRFKVTYQAVRKALASLAGSGVVEHVSAGFQLSRKWMLTSRSVIDDALRNYNYSKGRQFEPRSGTQVFLGNSLYEVDTLWGEIVVSICAAQSALTLKRFISINHYPWWIPMNVGHEIEFCQRLHSLDFTAQYLFSRKRPSTKWAKEFYSSFDVCAVVNERISITESHYYNVIGDYVIEVIVSRDHEKYIRKLFGGERNPQQIPPKELVTLSHMKGEIQISVQQNATFARTLLSAVGLDPDNSRKA